MTGTRCNRAAQRLVGLIGMVAGASFLFVGCGGGGEFAQTAGGGSTVASVGRVDPRIDDLLGLIEEVGMTDYSTYGRDLQARGRIRLVTTEQLDPVFNAFSWIPEECIWYSEIAFERYNRVDQAEILLHEMVHLLTGEATHTEVDRVCAEYRARAAAGVS